MNLEKPTIIVPANLALSLRLRDGIGANSPFKPPWGQGSKLRVKRMVETMIKATSEDWNDGLK